MPNIIVNRRVPLAYKEPVVESGGGAFDPTSLSSAVWGIDCELTTISGADVSSVSDEIGSRDLQQMQTAALPDAVSALGVNVLDFDDSAIEMLGFAGQTSDSITDFSIFVLMSLDGSTGNTSNIIGWGDDTTEASTDSRNGGWISITKVSGTDLRADLNGDSNQNLRTDAINTDPDWIIVELRVSAAGGAAGVADFWINGVEDPNGVTGQTIAALDLQSCMVGARRSNASPENPSDCMIAAAWVLESPSADDIEKMEGYLGHWGNQTGGLLPGGHAYKSSPPTT